MTEEKLLESLSDLPQYNYFYFAAGDSSLGDLVTSRAYFSFVDESSIISFRDKYDGLPLESVKGIKYFAVVEFAPYQGIPKRAKKKVDGRIATIEQDLDYQGFLEALGVKKEPLSMAELSAYVDSLAASKVPEVQKTPLIEYLTENHRRGRSSKRSKAAGDPKKKRSKEFSRAVKESRFKGEDGTKGSGGGGKEWGMGKTKKELKEKGGKRSSADVPTDPSTSSSSIIDDRWSGSSSDRIKERGKGWKEGGRGGREGERDGEGRREGGKGDRGRRGGGVRRGRREGGGEAWVREGGGRRVEGDGEGGWRGGSGYREKRWRQSGEDEGKAKQLSTRNKDRPDQAIYSPRGRSSVEYNHTTGNEGSTEVRKVVGEREDSYYGQASRPEGWKKNRGGQVNDEKSQPRSHGGWDEYGGVSGGKGRRHEGGGGGRRGRNRDAHYESASGYHDK